MCYLRNLPCAEQLHWLSYNENPKDTISNRAFTNDFEGEFVRFSNPREQIMSTLRRWKDKAPTWWVLRDEELMYRANTPVTTRRDEWGGAFLDLSQLIIEGFETRAIRKMLDAQKISYSKKDDKTFVMLEKLITNATGAEKPVNLTGLRQAQAIRSKVKGHAGSSEGKKLAEDALALHGSYAKHFDHICQLIQADMETIERICNLHKI